MVTTFQMSRIAIETRLQEIELQVAEIETAANYELGKLTVVREQLRLEIMRSHEAEKQHELDNPFESNLDD